MAAQNQDDESEKQIISNTTIARTTRDCRAVRTEEELRDAVEQLEESVRTYADQYWSSAALEDGGGSAVVQITDDTVVIKVSNSSISAEKVNIDAENRDIASAALAAMYREARAQASGRVPDNAIVLPRSSIGYDVEEYIDD